MKSKRIFAAQGLDGRLRVADRDGAYIGARCPTCAAVSEAPVVSGTALLTPELRDLHPDCDHKALLAELNMAVRDLAEYFDWKEL